MASSTSDSSNSSSPENNPETNPNPSSSKAIITNPSNSDLPFECLFKFVVGSVSGALVGYAAGCGYGLISGEGFKGSLVEAGSAGKRFAVASGIQGLVRCYLKRMRGKDDAMNHGVAGCCAGLALSFPGMGISMFNFIQKIGFAFLIHSWKHNIKLKPVD